jgi:hypothetical protein
VLNMQAIRVESFSTLSFRVLEDLRDSEFWLTLSTQERPTKAAPRNISGVSNYSDSRGRSYSGGIKAEISGTRRCSVDIELISDTDEPWNFESNDFRETILAPGEYELIRDSWAYGHPQLATLVWSSKEALSKGLGDALSYDPRALMSPLAWGQDDDVNWLAELRTLRMPNAQTLVIWTMAPKS